jgi:iron-sulfur cluster assembly protein
MLNDTLSINEFPVTITETALVQVKRLLAKESTPGAFLRLGVKGGGCSGLEYVMKIDREVKAIDLMIEVQGVKIVCDAKSATYLQDSVFDYSGNLIGGGFKFENPNAVRTCGCGTSFSPKRRAV